MMDKSKKLICLVVLNIMALLPFAVSAQIAINNEADLINLGTIYGGTSSNPTVVYLTSDILITDVSHFIIIGGDYVTFDGKNFTITIDTGASYPGLFQNGSPTINGYSNITIKNLRVTATNTALINSGGWIGQGYYGFNATNVFIDNCHSDYSTATVGNNAGGIVGQLSPATVTNCSSNGAIPSNGGGIAGRYFSGTVINCHSTGAISANGGG